MIELYVVVMDEITHMEGYRKQGKEMMKRSKGLKGKGVNKIMKNACGVYKAASQGTFIYRIWHQSPPNIT